MVAPMTLRRQRAVKRSRQDADALLNRTVQLRLLAVGGAARRSVMEDQVGAVVIDGIDLPV